MPHRNPERSPAHYSPTPSLGSAAGARTVEQLAGALTDTERRELYHRISKSLNIEQSTDERIIHGELRQERRAELIAADLRAMSMWERLKFWLRRVVSVTNDDSVFIQFRIDQMRQALGARGQGIVDWENKLFLAPFATRIFELYRIAAPTAPFFRAVWSDPESVRRMTAVLLSKRIPNAKSELSQFVSTQELQETYRRTESRAALKQLVLERIADYINSVHPDVIRSIEAGLLPAYLMKDVVLFDYGSFFSLFQVDIRQNNYENIPDFRPASASRALPMVEEFFLTLHSVAKIGEVGELFPELVSFFLAARTGKLDETSSQQEDELPPPDEDDAVSPTARLDPAAAELRTRIAAVGRELRKLREKVPFVEIIRAFRDDPYYRCIAYVPKVRLLDFYHAHLKVELLTTLDQRFAELRMGVLGRLLQEIFSRPLADFEFFQPEIPRRFVTAGMSGLMVHRVLQVIWNFVIQVYRVDMTDFLRILGRIVPARGRDALSDLTLLVAGFDDVAEKLKAFDLSFSGDTDEGKSLSRFRPGTDRDSTQINALRALIGQKEREARIIVEKFNEQVRGMRAMLERVRKLPHEHLSERYATYDSTAVAANAFDARLMRIITKLEAVEKAVAQVTIIEREG